MAKSVIQEIYDGLKGKIHRGEITDRIVEQDIAKEYGVSRTPVREVIRQLVMEGILISIPNLGTFVKQYNLQEIINIYEIRGALEGLAAQLASQRITEEESKELSKTAENIEKERLAQNWLEVYELDKKFHEQLVACARNENLEKLIKDYNFKITCAYSDLFQAKRFTGEEFQGVSHVKIAKAVVNHKANKAEELMKAHIAWYKQFILL